MEKINLNIVVPLSTRIANKAHKGFVFGILTVTVFVFANSVNGYFYRAAEAKKLEDRKL